MARGSLAHASGEDATHDHFIDGVLGEPGLAQRPVDRDRTELGGGDAPSPRSCRVVNFTKGKATVSTGVQSLAKDLGSMQASEIVDLNKGDTKLTVTVDGKKVGEMRELTGPAEAYMIAISYDRQGKPRAMMVRNSARTVPMTATPQ